MTYQASLRMQATSTSRLIFPGTQVVEWTSLGCYFKWSLKTQHFTKHLNGQYMCLFVTFVILSTPVSVKWRNECEKELISEQSKPQYVTLHMSQIDFHSPRAGLVNTLYRFKANTNRCSWSTEGDDWMLINLGNKQFSLVWVLKVAWHETINECWLITVDRWCGN